MTTTTPDLAKLQQAVQAYQPNPHRIPFHELKPHHASIVELRNKKAPYAIIADLLQQSGVKTSRARVAEYGRIVLEGGKNRKRSKLRYRIPPAAPEVKPPTVAAILPVTPPTAGSSLEPRPRGPHIACVRMVKGSMLFGGSPGQAAVKAPGTDEANASEL